MIGEDASGRIRSLRDPSKKQSKSDPNDKSRITLRDPPAAIRKKIKRAITDFTSEVTYDPVNRPAVANLVGIHALVKNVSPQEICDQSKGLDTGKYVIFRYNRLFEMNSNQSLIVNSFISGTN